MTLFSLEQAWPKRRSKPDLLIKVTSPAYFARGRE
jgi:hypothetical protein